MARDLRRGKLGSRRKYNFIFIIFCNYFGLYVDYNFFNEVNFMTKGVVMLFFGCSFILFVGATFLFIKNESSNSKLALDTVKSSDNKMDKFIELSQGFQNADMVITNILKQQQEELDKIKNKIEWLEMKSNIKSSKPIKIEPVTIRLIYKKSSKVLTSEAATTKVIKSVREKMKGINQ